MAKEYQCKRWFNKYEQVWKYRQKTNEITEEDKLRMKPLFALTGIERRRLLEGKWVADDFDRTGV